MKKNSGLATALSLVALLWLFSGSLGLAESKGKKVKVQGVIVQSQKDQLVLVDEWDRDHKVRIQADTEIEELKKNFFRSPLVFSQEDLKVGLLVQVEGRRGPDGSIQAEEVKFTQRSLKVAEAVAARVLPVEKELSRSQEQIRQLEGRFEGSEKTHQKISGDLEDLKAGLQANRQEARQAKDSAYQALQQVERVKARLDQLDNYDLRRSETIYFAANSAQLSEEAKARLDQLAQTLGGQTGYLIEVAGFASADGPEEYNRKLSQQRAQAVMNYLAEVHQIPLRRMIQPFGFGEKFPVADNATVQGRQQNRRVEVNLFVNQALTPTQHSAQAGQAVP